MPPSDVDTREGQRAFENAPGGILSFDDSGRIAFVNTQLCRLLDAEPESLVGTTFDRLLSPAGRVFHSTHVFPLLKLKGRVEELFMEFRKKSGEDVPMLVSATRAIIDGKAMSYCTLLTMGQRKQLEAALVDAKGKAEAATAAKDQFLAVISHELRSPLSAIHGWARVGMSEKADSPMRLRALETIERNTHIQARLIDDLLDIARIVSGKMSISPKALDLAPIIESAIDTARPAAQSKSIALQVDVGRENLVVFADPDRFQQIAWNLLNNAIKFTPKGGTVRVSLSRVSSALRLTVADSGQGIASEQLPFVFERFWQSNQQAGTTTGLGLGLSICKNLVELHGGTIKVDSGGPGCGTAFNVEIPLSVSMSGDMGWSGGAAQTDHHPLGISLGGLNILVVDDNEDARTLLRMLLTAAGASVTTVETCDEALAQLAQAVPDLLMSDIGLAGTDGLELIRRIRSGQVPAAKSIPAIAVTGMARPQDRVALLRAGFQAHVIKPIEPAEVTALVLALIKKD